MGFGIETGAVYREQKFETDRNVRPPFVYARLRPGLRVKRSVAISFTDLIRADRGPAIVPYNGSLRTVVTVE